MTRALAILVAVLVAHYGYLSVDEQAQSWAFYILRGVEGAVIGLALFGTFPKGLPSIIGGAACWILIFEESQTAVCGWLATEGNGNALCVDYFGGLGYAFIVCIAAASYFMWKRRR